ncbi:MAG: hypothetical protein JO276_07580 [Sphingomonadaceae bacterium]|nr:hypothetical protein [Sphingomonadaceae bacterium]
MPEQLLSLRNVDPQGDGGLRDAMHRDFGPFSQGTFVDGSGAAVGEPIDVPHFDAVHLEHPDDDGAMAARQVVVPPVVVADPHAAATSLAIATPSGAVHQLNLADLPSHPAVLPPPVRDKLFGSAGARLVFPVIAERFESEDQFLALVEGLRAWIVSKPPFNQDGVGDQLALRALFWPSHPDVGLFGTGDSQCRDRLFFGDRVVAKRLLDPFIGAAPASLILINSTVRGGAGGSPGYSAWASIAEAPFEHWQAVGLHEIGHALGLGDEYLDAQRQNENPATLEPNISAAPRADQSPWRARINVDGTLAPSHPTGAPEVPPGAIGTFQGARYRTDRYRATAHCLMRETTSDFCPICQDHIRAVLG